MFKFKKFLNLNMLQLLGHNIHLGNKKKKNDPFSSNVLKTIRQNLSIINVLKTSFFLKILFNHIINVVYENQTILLNDSNLFNRTASRIVNYDLNNPNLRYDKYIVNTYGRWKTGSLSNFGGVQCDHKARKILLYRLANCKKFNEIILDNIVISKFEDNSCKFRFPNMVYNLFNHNEIIFNEAYSAKIPLISSLDSDMKGHTINYMPIPGNNDSLESLFFYRSFLFSIIKFSVIKNLYVYKFLLKKKKIIKNYKKLCSYNFLYYKLINNK